MDADLMFVFNEGTVLSRRGDLTVLADGHLGLETANGSLHMCSLPTGTLAKQLVVEADGSVMRTVEDGATTCVGQIQVCRVARLAQLTSADGMLFRCESPVSLISSSEEPLVLRPGTLEQSNVTLAAERELHDHLLRLYKNALTTQN